jgi:stage V sporulation protein D (sporulation-specific penicillin-binding protein)
MFPNKNEIGLTVKRVRIWYGLLVLVLAIFILRLFYLQVIHHAYYRAAALSDQLKQYQIPATRGIIEAYDGKAVLPIVLNQQLYTLYADPANIKHADETAAKVAAVTGGDVTKYAKLMKTKNTRYAILAKKVSGAQQAKITALKLPGVGTQAQDYRTYPQSSLAAQVLGFVDNDGQGKYGIEQALDKQLQGEPGQVKAITDASGVPLAASKDNTLVRPKNGRNVVLTIDLALQQQLENILAQGVKNAKAPAGSALIMDVKTGAIKAMANVPTYDPAKYNEVEDGTVFQNAAVAHPIEVGSSMKVLTTAAALDQGVIKPGTTYYDPASWKVDGFKITNIEEDGGAGTRSINDIVNLSLNTGATWELMQMGGGQINTKARQAWHDYLVNRYMFGKSTGIEQGYEADGLVPDPADNGAGIDLTYANTAFGQAMTATPVQMGAALSAVLNGGTYYQPRLIDQYIDGQTGGKTPVKPKVVKSGIVSPTTGQALIPMMQYTVEHHNFSPGFDQNAYMVGGKTGTAQIAKPGGGYFDNLFNGTYVGFVGGDAPDYVIVVFVQKPTIGGYAGTAAAQPVFGNLAHMLINNSYVMPKGQ